MEIENDLGTLTQGEIVELFYFLTGYYSKDEDFNHIVTKRLQSLRKEKMAYTNYVIDDGPVYDIYDSPEH